MWTIADPTGGQPSAQLAANVGGRLRTRWFGRAEALTTPARSTQSSHREGCEPIQGDGVATSVTASVAALLDAEQRCLDLSKHHLGGCSQCDVDLGSRRVTRQFVAIGLQLVQLVDPESSLLAEFSLSGVDEGDRWCVGWELYAGGCGSSMIGRAVA